MAVAPVEHVEHAGVRRERHPVAGEHDAGREQHVGEVVLPPQLPGLGVEHGHDAEVVDHRHRVVVDRGLDRLLERRRHRRLPLDLAGGEVARLDAGVAVAVADREHHPAADGPWARRCSEPVGASQRSAPVARSNTRTAGDVGLVPGGDHRAGVEIDACPRPQRARVLHRPPRRAGRGVERGEGARVVADEDGVARDRDRVRAAAVTGRRPAHATRRIAPAR